MAQDVEKLPRVATPRRRPRRTPRSCAPYREAVALIQLKAEEPAEQIAAVNELKALGSIPSRDFLKQLIKDSEGEPEVVTAAQAALKSVESHVKMVNAIGTGFRGSRSAPSCSSSPSASPSPSASWA